MALLPRPTEPIAGGLLINPIWLDYLRSLNSSGDRAGIEKAIVKLQQDVAQLQQDEQKPGVEVKPGAGVDVYTPDGSWFRVALSAPVDGNQYAMQDGAWAQVQASSEQLMQRMTDGGDFRVTADGNLRVSTWR